MALICTKLKITSATMIRKINLLARRFNNDKIHGIIKTEFVSITPITNNSFKNSFKDSKILNFKNLFASEFIAKNL